MTAETRTRAHDLALAIRHYLSGEEEAGRLQAYQVARDAMARGVGLLEMATEHHEALMIVLSRTWAPDDIAQVLRASAELLQESLGPFEMAYRGFQEANEALVHLNGDAGDSA
jgi:hypothetical protein